MNGFVAPSGPSGECREVLCSVVLLVTATQ